jgi:ABC-2 type transport system permease protein
MSVNNALQLVDEGGWRSGFVNFLRKENGVWWRTSKWWVQSLVWFFILNGLVVLLLWIVPSLDPGESPPPGEVFDLFIQFFTVSAIGVMIFMQGVIVNEKNSGTAAWIMSNPVSRSAFILAKFIAHTLAIFVVVVVLQSLIAYVQFALKGSAFLQPLPFIAAISIHSLHLLFYISLAIFLGTVFNARGPVIGISLGIFFMQDIVGPLLAEFISPYVTLFLPTTLTQIATTIAKGGLLPSLTPIIATSVYSLALVLAAIWRFRREEF